MPKDADDDITDDEVMLIKQKMSSGVTNSGVTQQT